MTSQSERDLELAAREGVARAHRRIGRYVLRNRIGTGGMGDVYLAQMTGLGGFERWVAVKVLREEMAASPRYVSMFLDELRVLTRLSHPNLCAVIDFGIADGRHYLVLEYLHGEPLSAVVGRMHGAALTVAPRELAARIVAEAARGLHAAHTARGPDGEELGIVHRDVSPQNVFVLYEGATKVVDFGIALVHGRERRTLAGEVRGKLGYASPEQLTGGSLDRRSDTFSLGIVLWEAVVGRRLFRADSDGETVLNVMNKAVPRPSELLPDFPAELERIVLRALQRGREERYQSAAEMADALEHYLASLGRPIGAAQLSESMHRLFPDRLSVRETLLRDPSNDPAALATEPTRPAATASSWVSTSVRVVAPRRWVPFAAAAAALVLIGGAIALTGLVADPGTRDRSGGEFGRVSPDLSAPDPATRDRTPPPLPAAPPTTAPTPPTETPIADPGEPSDEEHAAKTPAARATGELNVLTTPVYATVWAAGRRLGTTPLYRARLPVGTWTLRLQAEGIVRTVRVQIRPGRVTSVSVPLRRSP